MKIEKDRLVTLVYELRESDSNGRIIEVVEPGRPLTFIFGTGRLLPHFEENLASLRKDDKFSFILTSKIAYGEKREDLFIDIPITVFHKDGRLDENVCQVGNEVPMMDRNGNRINGIINEISEQFVKMDFNHPMAGTDLWFSGSIIEVREATAEEMTGMNSSCSTCGSRDSASGCSSGSCK